MGYDAGYRILSNIRSSPSYWETKKKELMALLRQLGKQTFFLTLTAKEKRCPELLQVLYEYHHNKDITLDEAMNLDDAIKTEMIRNDPVMCARYFDYKAKKFVNYIKKQFSIFGKYRVVDSYARVEFQMRGAPHEHIMLWIEGIPTFDTDNAEQSEFMTCLNDESISLVSQQKHRHTRTCYKKKGKGKKCRFGFPHPMMLETRILHPLEESEEPQRSNGKDNYAKIKKT